jgi:DNA-binding YbaB/EbfC family protein
MAKGKGQGMRLPVGGVGGMLSQLQKMQEDMAKTHEALGEETLEVSAGGGAITVVITGHQKILSITISPEVIDPDDVEMLQDLVVAAVNEAIEKSQKMVAERMGEMTGGLGSLASAMGLSGLM